MLTIRCLPSLLVSVLCHGFTLYHLCRHEHCDSDVGSSSVHAHNTTLAYISTADNASDDVTASLSYTDGDISAVTNGELYRNWTQSVTDDDITVTSSCECSFWFGYK